MSPAPVPAPAPGGMLTRLEALAAELAARGRRTRLVARPAARHNPGGLAATTRDGARADRCHATPAFADIVASWQDLAIGSYYRAVAVTFDLTRLQDQP